MLCRRRKNNPIYVGDPGVGKTGVDPFQLLGLSAESAALIDRMELWASDLILLMPVRVTEAKNIEYAMKLVAALKKRDCHPKLVLTGPPDPHDPANLSYYESLLALRNQLDIQAEMRFVFESGPNPEEDFTIDQRIVADLYRVADVMFMPSHREGFGMPVLEAGLVGLPVICTAVPAAIELAPDDVLVFPYQTDPSHLADQIMNWASNSQEHRLRVRVRQKFTWKAIFEREMLPLLDGKPC